MDSRLSRSFCTRLFVAFVLTLGIVPPSTASADAVVDLTKYVNGSDANTPPGVLVVAGAPITWTYVVTNTSPYGLSGVVVTDSVLGGIACPANSLASGASMTCTAFGVAQAGAQSNTGRVEARFGKKGEVATDEDMAYYFGASPAVDIEKFVNGLDADLPPGPTLQEGSTAQFTFIVTNTGNVVLTHVVVSDNRLGAVTCPKTTLQPGESMTCTASETAQVGQHGNIATVVGTPPVGADVTDSDAANYLVEDQGTQGCTPGYWKNHVDSWPATGYAPSQTVVSVFASSAAYPYASNTLLEALGFGGGPGVNGAAEILLRAAVAALLNASHPDVDYPRTTASVITSTNSALNSADRPTMLSLAAALDADNNLGCPLN